MTQDAAGAIDLLEELCTVDSRTLEGSEGATQVAARMGEELTAMGFALEWFDTEPPGERGRHLKAVRNPGAGSPLMLLGHADTIMSPADVPFRRDDAAGKVYGSGVCDMKGGNVILLEALRRALTDPAVQKREVVVMINCAEEYCEMSFRTLARDAAAGALACLNFEPSPPADDGAHQVIVARKSVVRFHLTCTGRAAHAGNDHSAGLNAIHEIARKVEQIQSLTDYDSGLTANVGRISGGSVSNQVADKASIWFEVRAFDPPILDAAFEALQPICSTPTVASPVDGATTSLELHKQTDYPPWPRRPETDVLAERYMALAEQHGLTVRPVARGGGADISHVAGQGPCLDGLGILGGGMHTPHEWADVASLPARIATAADLIVELCGKRQEA